jgi:hypothetical protein
MKKLLLASAACAILAVPWSPKPLYAAEDGQSEPAPARFRPSQQIWQCNDIRITVTNPQPGVVNYDIGGTIWGGINFTAVYSLGPNAGLYLRGVPCARLR